MAINVVRGIYGLALVGGLYLGIRDGIVASPLSNNVDVIPKNSDGKEDYHEYANRMAKELGVNREITVIKGTGFVAYGNNLFCMRAGIRLPLDENHPELVIRHMIIHEIAHVKFNDILTWTFIPLIVSIFTSVVLNSRFPMTACIAGLATGMISCLALHRWREKQAILTAIKHSSKEMNEAFLEWLEEEVDSDVSFQEQCYNIFYEFHHPSTSEIIHCYQAHLGVKV